MTEKKRKTRARGNGQGTAYQRPGQKTWTVEVVVGWKHPGGDPSKPRRPVRRTKGGFATKRSALEYAASLRMSPDKPQRMTLEQVWMAWKPFYSPRIGVSAMEGYKYAYNHFSALHGVYMDKITADDLQACMDACKAGKRTHENMRCIANLLWKYAVDKGIVPRNAAENLFTGRGVSVQREPITAHEEATIRAAIGQERYAEYIYALCWLGYRPGEFLRLRKDQVFCARLDTDDGHLDVWYCVNGSKTDAGRDRVVIVPDEILPIVLSRLFVPGTDLLFPQYVFSRGTSPIFRRFKEMTDAYFRVEVFKPMMARLGIAEGKVPYGARHTYADKLKNASGSEKDKAQLIGHSNYAFTVDKYQSSHLKDLYDLVNSFSPEKPSEGR